MTRQDGGSRALARGWPRRICLAMLLAMIAGFASLAGAPAAQAQEWLTPYDSNKSRFAARSNLGYAPTPDVAPRRQKSRSAAVRSDDDSPKQRRTRSARAKSSDDDSGASSRPKVGGGHVAWSAPSGCLPGQLKSVIAEVSSYGRVVVTSTARGHSHNARVGGAKGSYHLSCQAADLRVHGNVGAAASFLRNHGSVGGFHHYGGGLFHIDTGPKRTW